MAKGRKRITFDLDTEALKLYYPSESWNNAYEIIKRHMVNNGFSWVQGSVYVSNQPMITTEVTHIWDELVVKNPWLNLCMCDCHKTNIGKEHDKGYVVDKNVDISI